MDEVTAGFESMVRRIHVLPSIMAVFPFKVRGGRYSWSTALMVLSLLLRACLAAQAVLHLFHPPIITRGLSRQYRFFVIGTFEYDFFVSCYSYVRVFVTRKSMDRAFRKMHESDSAMGGLRLIPDYSCDVLHDALILALLALPTTIRFLDLKGLHLALAAEQIYLTWVNFCIYLSVAPFLRLVTVLRKRFVLLQRTLLDCVQRRGVARIERLAVLHTGYCDICDSFNECFSSQILLVFTVAFLNIATGSYKSITAYIIGQGLRVIIIKGFVCLEYIVCIFAITAVCEAASEEAKEFNTLLYQLMIDDKTNEISNNKKLRLHIAMKREVVFTACGFFNLDYTLVHSMIAAATTYLVIMIQFEEPSAGSTPRPLAGGTNNIYFINTTSSP